MTREKMEEIARGGIERNLGDVAGDYQSEDDMADAMFDECYTLAHDALVDRGVDPATACDVARSVAQCYAQP